MSEIKYLSHPKMCPAPDHCACIARSFGDPTADSPISAWCMGVRTDDRFPGKEKGIKNYPCDVIVHCALIGSHSEDSGAHTFLSNIHDQVHFLSVLLTGLKKLGILTPVLRSVLNLNRDLKRDLCHALSKDGFPIFVFKGARMHRVTCSCGEELFRSELYEEEPRELIQAHERLGHTVTREVLVFDGRRWKRVSP
ncbi:hypothetical protein DRN85_09560 [Methanosarcinales archaeon]|nr:MAG: hypothetical protein DRN85_09560 [Methanosarcinales archaeon]